MWYAKGSPPPPQSAQAIFVPVRGSIAVAKLNVLDYSSDNNAGFSILTTAIIMVLVVLRSVKIVE